MIYLGFIWVGVMKIRIGREIVNIGEEIFEVRIRNSRRVRWKEEIVVLGRVWVNGL